MTNEEFAKLNRQYEEEMFHCIRLYQQASDTTAADTIKSAEFTLIQLEQEACATGRIPLFANVAKCYRLSGFERLVLGYLYGRYIGSVEAEPGPAKLKDFLSLYGKAHSIYDDLISQSFSETGMLCQELIEEQTGKGTAFSERCFQIRKNVAAYLKGHDELPKQLIQVAEMFPRNSRIEDCVIHEGYLKELLKLYKYNQSGICINLYGQEGIGRRFLVRQLAAKTDRPVFFLDAGKVFLYSLQDIDLILTSLRFEQQVRQAILCVTNFSLQEKQERMNLIFTCLLEHPDFSFLLSNEKVEFPSVYYGKHMNYEIPALCAWEKKLLWEACEGQRLAEAGELAEYISKYYFTAADIKQIFYVASCYARMRADGNDRVCKEDVRRAIKQESKRIFGGYARKLDSPFTFQDLVLSNQAMKQLQLVYQQILYRDVVGESWGFFRKMPYGRGTSVLFYGAPGTGKTMAAQVLANELSMELYRVDSSQLISKYIGETEKNVSELFERAKNVNAILFFDEADSLFARRLDIADSNDRNANAETAHLLQKFEEYDGMVILATNYVGNIDPAFKRRIKFMVSFDLPSAELRTQLWKKSIPGEAQLAEEIQFAYFAQKYEMSGSDIKETVWNAAFLAVAEQSSICNRHIEEMIFMNYQKQGKLLSREECLFLR